MLCREETEKHESDNDPHLAMAMDEFNKVPCESKINFWITFSIKFFNIAMKYLKDDSVLLV